VIGGTASIQPQFEFDNFKHHPERDILECISWLNGSFSSSDHQNILEEGVEIPI
jgi:hypothetical protein